LATGIFTSRRSRRRLLECAIERAVGVDPQKVQGARAGEVTDDAALKSMGDARSASSRRSTTTRPRLRDEQEIRGGLQRSLWAQSGFLLIGGWDGMNAIYAARRRPMATPTLRR